FAAERIAAWLLAAPPSPQFSPAECQLTPWALMRGPRSGSPGQRWDRPQPLGPAICRLWACALATRPGDSLYGARPLAARNWLTWASSCWTRLPSVGGAGGFGVARGGPGVLAGGEVGGGAVGPAPGVSEAFADGDGLSFV